MKIFQAEYIQVLPVPLDEAWTFFSDPANLNTITPPDMNFEIISGGDAPMFPGQKITYRVSPFRGFRLKWVTEITQVHAPYEFVDEQRSGPYRLWKHRHIFRKTGRGTEMRDELQYALSPWVLPVHSLLIRPRIEAIFNFRKQKLRTLFGDPAM